MRHVEQVFAARVAFLRLRHSQSVRRHDFRSEEEDGEPVVAATVRVLASGGAVVAQGHAGAANAKHAVALAMRECLAALERRPDPCSLGELAWRDAWDRVRVPVTLFAAPPAAWFAAPQVLGVYWEGGREGGGGIVQIAGEYGVAVDAADAEWAREVLADERHVHAVFGARDEGRREVAQQEELSLAEIASRRVMPRVRLARDDAVPGRVDWALATSRRLDDDEALAYAAADAQMTRLVALHAEEHPDLPLAAA